MYVFVVEHALLQIKCEVKSGAYCHRLILYFNTLWKYQGFVPLPAGNLDKMNVMNPLLFSGIFSLFRWRDMDIFLNNTVY
jgi:hypothetical protein